jgi:ADP-ribosyl-[dinitrogen reductase] hydrolase
MNLHDKVRGCFLGIAIGDALGKPVECVSHDYGMITDYLQNPNHKYFDGEPAGTWSDDTQLSLAVARAFIASGEFDLDAVAEEHCSAFMQSVMGWGGTTREAVAKMVDGTPWNQASLTDQANRGFGNGVAMKVAPVGLYMGLTNPACNNPQWKEDIKRLVQFATMTHFTSMAITSGFAQAFAVFKCLTSSPENFDVRSFCRTVSGAGRMGKRYLFKTITKDDMAARLAMVENYDEWPPERIVHELRGGPYVYESLPFTFMFFARNPHGIDSLYNVVSAGGDADTNGSMLGALLGALHGTSVFPEHLVDGLHGMDEIMSVADRFYHRIAK